MDTLTMSSVFVASIVVSGAITWAFAGPIDIVLDRLMTREMADGWSRFVKFAVFVVSLAGGLRLREIEILADGSEKLNGGHFLLEVYKTISGSLTAAVWPLLAFFCGSIVVYAAMRLYAELQLNPRQQRPHDRHATPAERY